MMRVLVLHWGRSNAGPRLTRAIANALSECVDTEVHLSYSRNSDSASMYRVMRMRSLAIATYTSSLTFAWAVMRSPFIAFRLSRYCRQNSIDVILTTMYNPLQTIVLSMLLRPRVVACVHDAAPHPGDSRLYRLALEIDLRRADTAVAFSSLVGRILRERIGAPRVVETVHGAFGDGVGGTVAARLADRPLVVGMFGRLGPYQGVDRFVAAVDILLGRGIPVTARVVGRGDDSVRDLAKARPDIDWDLRWIPEEETDEVVASFDVLALPYREASQSGVFALAIGNGVPVVVSPVGGLADQVSQTGAGLIAKGRSVEDFADAMQILIMDRSVREQCASAASDSARGSQSWATAAETIRAKALSK